MKNYRQDNMVIFLIFIIFLPYLINCSDSSNFLKTLKKITHENNNMIEEDLTIDFINPKLNNTTGLPINKKIRHKKLSNVLTNKIKKLNKKSYNKTLKSRFNILSDKEREMIREYEKEENKPYKKEEIMDYKMIDYVKRQMEEEKLKNDICFDDSIDKDESDLNKLKKRKKRKLQIKTIRPIKSTFYQEGFEEEGVINLSIVMFSSRYKEPSSNLLRDIIKTLGDFNIMKKTELISNVDGKTKLRLFNKFYGSLTLSNSKTKRQINLSKLFEIKSDNHTEGSAKNKLADSLNEWSALSFSKTAIENGITKSQLVNKVINVIKKYNLINLLQNSLELDEKNDNSKKFGMKNKEKERNLNKLFMNKYLTDVHNLNLTSSGKKKNLFDFTHKRNIDRFVRKQMKQGNFKKRYIKKQKKKQIKKFQKEIDNLFKKNNDLFKKNERPYKIMILNKLNNIFANETKIFFSNSKNLENKKKIYRMKKKILNKTLNKIENVLDNMKKSFEIKNKNNEKIGIKFDLFKSDIIKNFLKNLFSIKNNRIIEKIAKKDKKFMDIIKNGIKKFEKKDKNRGKMKIEKYKSSKYISSKKKRNKNLNEIYFDKNISNDIKIDIKLKELIDDLRKIFKRNKYMPNSMRTNKENDSDHVNQSKRPNNINKLDNFEKPQRENSPITEKGFENKKYKKNFVYKSSKDSSNVEKRKQNKENIEKSIFDNISQKKKEKESFHSLMKKEDGSPHSQINKEESSSNSIVKKLKGPSSFQIKNEDGKSYSEVKREKGSSSSQIKNEESMSFSKINKKDRSTYSQIRNNKNNNYDRSNEILNKSNGKTSNSPNEFFLKYFSLKIKDLIVKYSGVLKERIKENKLYSKNQNNLLFKNDFKSKEESNFNKFKKKLNSDSNKIFEYRIKLTTIKEFFLNLLKGFNYNEIKKETKMKENYLLIKSEKIASSIICKFGISQKENSINYLPFKSLKETISNFNIQNFIKDSISLIKKLKSINNEIGSKCQGITGSIEFLEKYFNKVYNFREDYLLEVNDIKKIAYNELEKNSFPVLGYSIGKILGLIKKIQFYYDGE